MHSGEWWDGAPVAGRFGGRRRAPLGLSVLAYGVVLMHVDVLNRQTGTNAR